MLFGKYEFPITLETKAKEEYVLDEINYTKDQAEIIAKTGALAAVKKIIPENAEVINSEYKVFDDNNEVVVRVTVQCSESAGIKEEIKQSVM